ncbi:glycosyltransferase [Methylobacillus sp. Pita2]|uniref:glycosyltransferase family protein n=1 Tax=Methylobacillus sp. Pita2 TaxID=3383245 RepID=UPI0038B6212F
MKILFLSHTAAGGEFVVGSHQLSKQFALQGHSVVHLSPPITPAHVALWRKPFEVKRFKRWWRSGDVINQALDVIPASILPWGLANKLAVPTSVFGFFLKFSALRQLKRHDFLEPDIVLIDEPRLVYLLQYFPKAKIVYRPTDVYHEIRNDPSIIEAEKRVIAHARHFIATSEPVKQHLHGLGVNDVLLLQNGVDLEHYLQFEHQELSLPPAPRALYAGALDHRFGFGILRLIAQENPQVSFLMAGPVEDKYKAEFAPLANVHFLGHVKYAALPNLMQHCQFGLLPLSGHPSNAGRSPMKLFEYAAIGLPVVSSKTPELERRALPFVLLAETPQEFNQKLQTLLSVDLASLAQQAKEIALEESWASKVRCIINYLIKDTK